MKLPPALVADVNVEGPALAVVCSLLKAVANLESIAYKLHVVDAPQSNLSQLLQVTCISVELNYGINLSLQFYTL